MNKKVKNAQVTVEEDITFKSKLESICYRELCKAELNPEYEPDKIILMEGFYPENIPYYAVVKSKGTKEYKLDKRKQIHISYTPDFKVEYKGYIIYFDAKGAPNDTYPIKKKMFLNHLNNDKDRKYLFFEPRNLRQIKASIEIIKNL